MTLNWKIKAYFLLKYINQDYILLIMEISIKGIVITGGPGFGKTSVIKGLSKKKIHTGTDITKDLVQLFQGKFNKNLKKYMHLKGRNDYLPWNSRKNFEEIFLLAKLND